MKSAIFAAAALAATVFAAPTKRADSNIDVTVLNFALTLEHLEDVYYKQALTKFSEADFMAAGFDAEYYRNLRYISYDEQEHVAILTSALQAAGATPVKRCDYTFPYTDVKSFVTFSSVLEGVGTSAYLGAAGLITDKDYLTVAGAILALEAEHTAIHRVALDEIANPNPFYTPITPTTAYSIAAMLITKCPSDNPALGFTAFPALTVDTTPMRMVKRADGTSCIRRPTGGNMGGSMSSGTGMSPATGQDGAQKETGYAQGSTITLTSKATVPAGSYITYVSGLFVGSVQGTVSNGMISGTIPSECAGQTYVFVTKSDVEKKFDESQVISGPAIIEVAPAAPAINFDQNEGTNFN